jgi:hypothetical protein
MKTEQPILITSIKAAVNISKNYLVGFDGNICANNAKPLGVSNADTSTDEQLPLVCNGIALVYSYQALSQGDPLVCHTGKVNTADSLAVGIPVDSTPVLSDAAQPTLSITGSILPQVIVGYALDDASGADVLIRVLLV